MPRTRAGQSGHPRAAVRGTGPLAIEVAACRTRWPAGTAMRMSMATKTIVCPECQAPAAPGRYACEQCGALLASLALAAHADRPSIGGLVAADGSMSALVGASNDAMEPATTDHSRSVSPAPAWTHALAADPDHGEPILPPPREDERWDDEPEPARAEVP